MILLDIKMPNLDGIALVKIPAELDLKLPSIAQTAYAMVYNEERYLTESCDAYTATPVKQDKLFSIIKQVIK